MNFQQSFSKNISKLCKDNLINYPYIQDYLQIPGKQIRPALYLDLINLKKQPSHSDYQIASALEMLHLFFLVHDDIMDGDTMRRDHATIHAHYSKELGELKGQGIGIITGDLLFSRALKLFTENIINKEALSIIFDVIDRTAKGQINEYLLIPETIHKNPDATAELLNYYEEKTALYSIYLPLVLAYFQNHKTPDKRYITDLKKFSRHIGIAFQINDDLIEFKLEKIRNKENLCSDVIRGKITPILSTILKKSTKKATQKWIKEWQNETLTKTSHDEILQAGYLII
jgi:geranylgeranyl diphosphate synthase type II